MQENDYYYILQVTSNASVTEIRRAYRRLALTHHPDHHPEDPQAEERFKLISEAYSVLGDAQKRKEYDRFRNQHYSAFDIIERFGNGMDAGFRYAGRGNGCGRKQCGIAREPTFNVVQMGQLYEVFLTPQEAHRGAVRFVAITEDQKRRGYRIRIPAGINSGDQLKAILGRDEEKYIFVRVTVRA